MDHVELVAQGEDFCLQGGSRPERCTEGVKKRDDDRRHREAAYPCIAVTSIVTTRTDFLVGTTLQGVSGSGWSRRHRDHAWPGRTHDGWRHTRGGDAGTNDRRGRQAEVPRIDRLHHLTGISRWERIWWTLRQWPTHPPPRRGDAT